MSHICVQFLRCTGPTGPDHMDVNGYIERSKILQQQKRFQERDRELSAAIIPFINILDKGIVPPY